MSWEIGLSTGIGYREPIEEVLPAIAASGFRTIEVATARSHVDLKDSPRFVRVREQVDRHPERIRAVAEQLLDPRVGQVVRLALAHGLNGTTDQQPEMPTSGMLEPTLP